MKKVATFLLLFIITNSLVFSQTYKQFPINGEARYPIFDLDVYENQIAVLGDRNFNNTLQVYLHKDNEWKSLPLVVNINGELKNIPYQKSFGVMFPEIKFDINGKLWLVAIDGIYVFENDEWKRFQIQNINNEFSIYKKLILDKDGNVWVIAQVLIGTGNDAQGGNRLYRFENGNFYRYLEEFSNYPNDFPLEYETSLYNKDIKNSGLLQNGVMLLGDKRKLGIAENGGSADFVFTSIDGINRFISIPTIDKPIYSESVKKLNRIFVDSKDRVWFLMRFQQNYNQNTGIETACCSGIARLDNTTDWYTYTQENNTPYSMNFNDQYIRYATPVDMCEIKNNEYLFVMQNNGYTEAKNLQLYKLNSDNKFDTLQWKTYLQHATIFRPDYTIISEENLKKEIDVLMNGDLVSSKLEIKRMLADKYGNIWIAGENFIIKMTDNPTTSVAESIKKPTVIYPNPGNKSVRLSNNVESIVQIDVVTLLGENLLSIQKDFESIDVSSLPIGFYMVKIKRIDGSIEYVKYNKN
jgi:hypothetical protein